MMRSMADGGPCEHASHCKLQVVPLLADVWPVLWSCPVPEERLRISNLGSDNAITAPGPAAMHTDRSRSWPELTGETISFV